MVIFDDIFAPPIIAKTGFFPDFKTVSIAKISFSNSFPKNLLLLKNLEIIGTFFADHVFFYMQKIIILPWTV